MATDPSAVSPAGNTDIERILRLLANSVSPGAALVVSEAGPDLLIEEASINVSPGFRLRAPDSIALAPNCITDVSGTRLPTGWIELCGWRPRYIAVAPIANHRLHLVVACAETAPLIGDLTAIATAIGSMLDSGLNTSRERSTSTRIAALVDNLPLPIVFVDSRSVEVFLNDRARAMLELGQRDATEKEIAAAFARIIAGAKSEHRAVLANDPDAAVRFEIEREFRQFEVESKWIDDERLTGRLWIFRDITSEREIAASRMISFQLSAMSFGPL